MSGYETNNNPSQSSGSDTGSRGKNRIIFTAVCGAVILAVIALICISVIGCSARKKNKDTVDKGAVVLNIDGRAIYENEFRFFATLVLNQEGTVYTLLTEDNIDKNATVKNSVVNFAKEYIFRLRECAASGLSLSEDEKQLVLTSINNEYDQFKTVGDVTYEGDSFYDHYYGLTQQQYTDFWLDWALIEKYNSNAEAQADVSEESQKAAYTYFEKYLYGREITVLSLSADGKTDSEKEVLTTLARELKEQIDSGADMDALIQKHCDDDDLKESRGKITVTSIMEEYFPELYEWTLNSEEDQTGIVNTDRAIYIVRAGAEQTFEALKDSETMLEWTRIYVVDRQIDELVNSGKYPFTINDGVYNAIDLSKLIDDSLDSWSSYYASLEAGVSE